MYEEVFLVSVFVEREMGLIRRQFYDTLDDIEIKRTRRI